MVNLMCVLGEPAFESLISMIDKTEILAPSGQIKLCRDICLESNNDSELLLDTLRKEYLAIVFALNEMGIDFRIIVSHLDDIDKSIMNVSNEILNIRNVGFPENFPAFLSSYPRDLMVQFPNIVFFNSRLGKLGIRERNGCRIRMSPYGEGGRSLIYGKIMLVCDRISQENKENSSSPRLNGFKQLGIEYGLLPSFLSAKINLINENDNLLFLNDHVDRFACLLAGKDGNLNLIVDSNIITGKVLEKKKGKNGLEVIYPEESLQNIAKICNEMGIKLHCPKKLSIPYVLNLMQFPNGKVLMTSGDEEVYRIVAKIVGEENVVTTEVPIRYLPVYANAGIRCMINYIPEKLLKLNLMIS